MQQLRTDLADGMNELDHIKKEDTNCHNEPDYTLDESNQTKIRDADTDVNDQGTQSLESCQEQSIQHEATEDGGRESSDGTRIQQTKSTSRL